MTRALRTSLHFYIRLLLLKKKNNSLVLLCVLLKHTKDELALDVAPLAVISKLLDSRTCSSITVGLYDLKWIQ